MDVGGAPVPTVGFIVAVALALSQFGARPKALRKTRRAGAGGRVAFVCQHGALRSRIAAAFFNAWAPVGWSAISAGVKPQSQPSTRLVKVMAGTDAEEFVDRARPRSIADIATSEARVIAIDTLVPDAESWSTKTRREPGDVALRDEISRRVRALVDEIAATHGVPPD